jgi:hypothetical protein
LSEHEKLHYLCALFFLLQEKLEDYGNKTVDISNNLIGSAVTAVVAGRHRGRILIGSKDDAVKLAKGDEQLK